jgi:hypothetical protein
MAELLIRAKKHWMDDLKQEEIDKMTKEQKQSYDARSQIGDIIVVRPDGWNWGKEECLPNFVVVKVPQMTDEEAKKYEESLMSLDKEPILLKHRKYTIDKTVVDDVKTTIGSSAEFTKSVVLTKITEKK